MVSSCFSEIIFKKSLYLCSGLYNFSIRKNTHEVLLHWKIVFQISKHQNHFCLFCSVVSFLFSLDSPFILLGSRLRSRGSPFLPNVQVEYGLAKVNCEVLHFRLASTAGFLRPAVPVRHLAGG